MTMMPGALVDQNNNVPAISLQGQLPVGATSGFLLVPNIAGPPTGTPIGTGIMAGATAMAWDVVRKVLWCYDPVAGWNQFTGTRLLGKAVGVNLNPGSPPVQTVIFTLPASGFSRCLVTQVIIDNYSMAATTASISFGQSGTPTDWAATATNANAATGKFLLLTPTATLAPVYTTPGNTFVANVTIAQGAAATADITAFGIFE